MLAIYFKRDGEWFAEAGHFTEEFAFLADHDSVGSAAHCARERGVARPYDQMIIADVEPQDYWDRYAEAATWADETGRNIVVPTYASSELIELIRPILDGDDKWIARLQVEGVLREIAIV